jgi:hypothetical protein
VSLKLFTLEPVDINHINVKEEVYFHFDALVLESQIKIDNPNFSLVGNEKYSWSFGNGIVKNTFEPIAISTLYRNGGEYTIKLTVSHSAGVYRYEQDIFVFEFPKEIIGVDYIEFNTPTRFHVNILDNLVSDTKPTFKWFINGVLNDSSTHELLVDNIKNKSTIELHITNGTQTVKYKKVVIVTVPNTVYDKTYETNVTPNLMFFNKEGDNLNFELSEYTNGFKRWEGDLIIHPNSSDTFKTLGLYVMERVKPLSLTAPKEDIFLEKFQLFTENGIDFEPKYSDDLLIENIIPVNNNSDFYTKWIIANDINIKFPIGSEVYFTDVYTATFNEEFNGNLLNSNSVNLIEDFQNLSNTDLGLQSYTVIGNKRDAIMVITNTRNDLYTTSYVYGSYRDINNRSINIPQGKVKSMNLIKLYDTKDYNAEWNETSYKGLLYDKKKLSIVNSKKNSGIYTFNYINDDAKNKLVNKYIKIDTLNLYTNDKVLDNGFKVDINFKTNKILLSSSIPVDFLPYAKQNAFLNDRNIVVWEKIGKVDYTPELVKSGYTFFFNDTEMLYKTIKVDIASKLLKPQTDDTQGLKLILKDYNSLRNKVFTFNINDTVYTFAEGVDWYRGDSITKSVSNLSYVLNKVKGLSCVYIEESREILIWEKEGYKLTNTTPINDSIYSFHIGVLSDNNPKFGVVNDEWISLNTNYFDGYIHHKKNQGIYHIAYFNYDKATGAYIPTWYMLPVDKKIAWVEPTTDFKFKVNIIEDCYLTGSQISLTQAGDSTATVDTLVQRFIATNHKTLLAYGIDTYSSLTDLCMARLYPVTSLEPKDDYIDIKFSTNGENLDSEFDIKEIDYLNVVEDLTFEQNRNYGSKQNRKALSENWSRKIIIKDIDQKFGLLLNINGIEYPVVFDNILTEPEGETYDENEHNIIDIEETLMDWGNQRFKLSQNINSSEIGKKYYDVLESLGILVWLEKSEESYVNGTKKFDTIVLESKYPNVPITYSVNGTYDSHKILHSDVEFKEIGNKLTLTINRVNYSVDYQGTIPATLDTWLFEYSYVLAEHGIVIETVLNTSTGENDILRFSTIKEKTTLNYQVYVSKNASPDKELFIVTNWRTGNEGIIISSNEINLRNGSDFQDEGFATGMIMSIIGSNFPLNNQEYNLLFVDPVSLGLSYQGAFWDDTDTTSSILMRSGFDWSLYNEESGDSIGLNLIPNGVFSNDAWWVFNDTKTVHNNSVTISSNLGFKTPVLKIKTADYKLKFTSTNLTDDSKEFTPVTVSIFTINGNSLSLIYQKRQESFGAFDDVIRLDDNSYVILFSNGIENLYYNISNVSFEKIETVGSSTISLSTREFLRYPRERYDESKAVQFKFSWLEQDDKSLFLYDFSGEQLNKKDNGIYNYKGIKPLLDGDFNGCLNDIDNRDLTKIYDPKFQRTVWDELIYDLQLVDSETDLSPLPKPLQVFVGYKSLDEGVNRRTLLIHRLENTSLTINTTNVNDTWMDIVNFDADSQSLTVENNTINFIQLGFKKGQRVIIKGADDSNKSEQAVFQNAGFEGIIEGISVNKLVFKGLNKSIKSESSKTKTRSIIPPFREKEAIIKINIEVLPEEIGRFQITGQTEIEDERFKVQLNNFGFSVNHRDVFIFKEYDVNENGIDWTFLNTKRKEMLLTHPQIYNYLGSYKSLVNAINYFGYNDLELYEYYKNVDVESKDYQKLSKIEIPDIFDNRVAGYTPNDYILKSLPDAKFEKTRLFNLTYRMTDHEGNNILAYSLDEIVTKLIGLKRWLREEIMPIGTRIRDLTGRGSTTQSVDLWYDVKFSTKLRMRETISPVDFNIEAYLQPVENNSRTFNLNVNFFTNDDTKPDYFHVRITTYSAKPDYTNPNFKLKSVQLINEYRTDFKSYNFAADRKADPFILVEVTCDNGYGATYKKSRTYSLINHEAFDI